MRNRGKTPSYLEGAVFGFNLGWMTLLAGTASADGETGKAFSFGIAALIMFVVIVRQAHKADKKRRTEDQPPELRD